MVDRTNILLVNPRCPDLRVTDKDAEVVPIGLCYIGAALLENRFNTAILNLAQGSEDPLKVFERELERFKPDIIGFSVTNPNRWNAIDCAGIARRTLPHATIVFGGPAPTFLAQHLFDACPELDYIVPGEGEITFLKLARALARGKDPLTIPVAGLLAQKDGCLYRTADRPLIDDLDTLPHPSKYFTFQHLAMSRGCPGNCTFCGSPGFWGSRRVRFHSPRWIAGEIHALYQKGVTHFYISDDTFTMDKERVIQLCRLIRQMEIPITWNAISRVDCIDEELLLAMRTAGCIQISYGVESGSGQIRKTLGKPISDAAIEKAFALTRSYGILPRAYFIYGSPGETEDTIEDSVRLMMKMAPLSAVFYMLVIFPGTFLYRSAEQKNRISDAFWHQKIEDLPWFELDEDLNFETVKGFGDRLRTSFYRQVQKFAQSVELVDNKTLYPFHADFLSRLAMTFSHGEYAQHPEVANADETAQVLFQKALSYAPDPRAFLGLGMIMLKQRRFEQAIPFLEQGIDRFPDHVDLTVCMGVCLMNMGRFEKALTVFNPLGHIDRIRQYADICRQKIAG